MPGVRQLKAGRKNFKLRFKLQVRQLCAERWLKPAALNGRGPVYPFPVLRFPFPVRNLELIYLNGKPEAGNLLKGEQNGNDG